MINQLNGKLFVIAAPSGAGKTSLVKALIGNNDNITVAISHTTRNKRPEEENGVNYHFINKGTFEQMICNDGFLEHASVFGNLYGTSKQAVEHSLSAGNNLILEIDWQGAQLIRQRMPEARSIFILPPSIESLEERLTNRGQDDAETIKSRMSEAISEMSHYNEFDYLVVNDNFDEALEQIQLITEDRAPELAKVKQKVVLAALLANLLPDQPL